MRTGHGIGIGLLIICALFIESAAAFQPHAIAPLQPPPTRNDTVWTVDWRKADPVDATEAIQRAIDSTAATVFIPQIGQPWIVRPLKLRSNLRLVLAPGVVLEAKRGEFRGGNDSLFSAVEVHHLSLVGYGATIRMNKSDYQSRNYEKAEWRHGICLQGSENVEILGLRIENTGGDGVYIGSTWDDRRIPCKQVHVAHCTMSACQRQGISIVSGAQITIENSQMTGTSGSAPQAGVDIEPSHPRDLAVEVLVQNCRAEGNAGSGIMANLSRLTAKSEPVSITVRNCLIRGSVQPGLRAILRQDLGAHGWLEFTGCTIEDIELAGATVVWDVRSNVNLRFVDCTWSNVAKRTGNIPLSFELEGSSNKAATAGITFTNARLFDRRDRFPIQVQGVITGAIENISGEIELIGSIQNKSTDPTLPRLSIKAASR